MGASAIIALTVGLMAIILIFVFVILKKSGALGPSKANRELAAQLLQTGHKGRAMILAIQPTGMVVNNINIKCRMQFWIEPLHGGAPFEGEKTSLISQTAMPRIGEVWPCWFDPMDHTKFAVGQPNAINAEQIALFREFGIPHPLDPRPSSTSSPPPPPPPGR
jgi:hypothetical protein